MKGSFKLGNIAGIGIFIHWTFSILIAYIIFSNYRAGNNTQQIVWTILFILSVFVTVFLHELGHALAAKKYNIKTKDITILPIGGLARLERIPEKAKEELVVAIAGPAVNIVIAIITGLFITMPNMKDLTVQLSEGVNQNNFFLNFFIVNIWLAIFNLIPAFPMDGGRVLRALMAMKFRRHVATEIAARVGQLLAVGFIFVGFNSNPFLIFIGLFIILGAQKELEMAKTGFILKGIFVKDVIMNHYETINAKDTIETAVKQLLNGQCKNFLVISEGHPVGSLSRDEIIAALSKGDHKSPINTVMNKNTLQLSMNEPIEMTYQKILTNKNGLAMVYDNQKFVGVVDLDNILEFIMVKNAQRQVKGA